MENTQITQATQPPRGLPGPPGGDLTRVVNISAYACVAIGYLYGVLAAQHLTLAGFALFTLLNAAWVAAFWYLSERPNPAWLAGALAGLLAVLALTAQAMLLLGLEFDWLIPVITAAILFLGWGIRQALAGAGAIFALSVGTLALAQGLGGSQGPELFRGILPSALSILSAYIFVAIFCIVLQRQQALRERAELLAAEVSAAKSKLEEANTQLREFAEQVEELTVTRERNRMAREIHDTLGHYLTILAVKLETATRLEERADPRLRAELIEARRVASDCLAEVRHSVTALRPADPTSASFAQALRQLVSEFETAAPAVAVVLDLEGNADDLSTLTPELRLALYRCAQEALTNVRKHARATNVLLRVRLEPSVVELTVLDNGAEATATQAGRGGAGAAGGFGLVGMRERIALLGGSMTAGPEPEQGWRVAVVVPRHATPAADTGLTADGVLTGAAPADEPRTADAASPAAGGAA